MAQALPRIPSPSKCQLDEFRSEHGGRWAADRIVRSCELRITELARPLARVGCDLDQLEQAGRIASLRAARGYRPASGEFEPYVTRAMKNGFIDELTANPAIDQMRTDNGEDSHENPAMAWLPGAGREPHQPSTQTEPDVAAHLDLEVARNRLSPPEAGVIDLLYDRGLTQREAADRLGLSQPRVSQIHRGAINQLRATMRGTAA